MHRDDNTRFHLADYLRGLGRVDGVLPADRDEQHISIGSIHKLLVHCMAAQWIWLCRFRGESPTRLENHDDYPTRDALEQRWPLVHAAMVDFLGLQSPKALHREVRAVAEEIAADPKYADDEPLGPDEAARARFREFARKQLAGD